MAATRWLLLRSGERMPAFGFGTFQAKKVDLVSALECALDVGYRHIDTAIVYQNENEIGDVLARSFRTGSLKRKDVFITSKIPPVYMDAKDVRPQVKESLERLQTKYLDMLLIHLPCGSLNTCDGNLAPLNEKGERIIVDHDYIETWKVMECMMKEKYVCSIGLSNFNIKQMEEIESECTVPPSNLQSECHAYYQQNAIRDYCHRRNIIFTGYSPLGAPTRPSRYFDPAHKTLLEDPVVQEIAEQVKKTPAQVLLRFLSQIGVVPLPKSITPQRILDNFESMNFSLTENDMRRLKELNCGQKYFEFQWAKKHPRFPGIGGAEY